MSLTNPASARVDIKAWAVCHEDSDEPAKWRVHVKIYSRILLSQWLTKEDAEDMVLQITGQPRPKCSLCETGFRTNGNHCSPCGQLWDDIQDNPVVASRILGRLRNTKL